MLKQVLGDSVFRQLLVKLAQVVNSECDKLQFSLEISYWSSTDIVGGAKDRRGKQDKHHFASKGHSNSIPCPKGGLGCHFY